MTTSSTRDASGKSKNKNRILSRFMMTSALVAVGTFGFIPFADAADIELPVFGSLAGGNAIVTTNPALDKMNIDQETNRVIINWTKFNIGADATVQFYQPNSGSLAVNKVTDSVTFTRIDGKLKANGKVVILDPNGIIFGAGSVTDVGAIVASTGNVDNTAVMAGGLMQLTNFGTGQIVNNGAINAADSGLVAFVGSTVKNSGVINAKIGKVSLAAGDETATLDLFGDGLVELALSTKDGGLLSENTGTINVVGDVDGGTIRMTAAQAKNTVDSVVNMKGIARANSATVSNGKIILSAGGVAKSNLSKVKVGTGSTVKGNTTISAKSVDLDATIDGTVVGSASVVNVISNAAKISQGLDIIDTFGTIYVAAGTYNEHLIVNKVGVSLNGANAGISGSGVRGAETIVIPNSPGVTVTSNNVTIDGLAFMGAAGLDGYGIFVNGASGVTLKNNVIKDTSQHGIYALASSFINIFNNNIGATGLANNVKGDGINLDNSDGAVIRNNTIANIESVIAESGSGVYAKGSNNVRISNNDIYNTGWDGVKVQDGNNFTVRGNTITNTGRAGVAASFTTNSKIKNNTMTDLERWGVWSTHNQGLNIKGNSIDGVTKAHGIFSDWDTNTKIKNNTVLNIKRDGIHVQNTLGTMLIKGNEVGSTGGAENILGDGIHLINADGAVVTENTIANIKSVGDEIGSGVYAQESDNVTITDNTIYNTGWDGVKVRSGANFYVAHNTIHDTGRAGVAISESTNSTVEDNTMYNLRKWGIWSGFNTGLELLGNTINTGKSHGIFSDADTDTLISGNTVLNIKRNGIHVQNTFGTMLVNGNKVGSTGGAENILGDGIHLINADGAVVTGNTIANVKSVADEIGSGVYAQESDNVTITDNTIYNTGWDGVKVRSGANFYVAHNTIHDTGRAGVAASDTTNSRIKYNTMTDLNLWGVWSTRNQGLNIKGNSIDGVTKAHGIFSDWDTNTKIKNNTVLNIKRDGIHVQNTLGTMLIKGNKVGSTGVAKNIKGDGIYLYNADGAVVSDNHVANVAYISGEAGSGIYAENSDDVSIIDNLIHRTSWDGVKVVGGDNYQITGNTIYNTARAAVSATSATDSKIAGNTVYDLSKWGIWTTLNEGLEISNNTITNVGRSGIMANLDSGLNIVSNTINTTKINGITILNGTDVTASFNKIGLTGGANNINGDGIYVGSTNGATVSGNQIANTTSTGDEVGSGIYVVESDDVTVSSNIIHDVQWDGVKLKSGSNAIVIGNTIYNTTRAGVAASYTTDATISDNIMSNLRLWGVWSSFNTGIDITGNTINTGKSHGIFSDADTDTLISGNTVLNIKRDGIHVQNTLGTMLIEGNEVGSTGGAENILGDGIHLINADGAVVTGNTIANVKSVADEIGSGVYAQESDNVTITNNTIYKTGWDGVKVRSGDNFYVAHNTIHDTKRAGVAISESINSTVEDNTMYNLRKWGIWSSLNNDTDLLGNDIEFVYQRHGILSYLDTNITIDSNTINTVPRDGIRVQDGSGVVNITNNTVTNAGWNGVYVLNYSGSSLIITLKTLEESSPSILSGLYINNNIISNSGSNGIYVDGASGYVEIKSNDITDSGNNGIYVYNSSVYYNVIDRGDEMMKSQFVMDYPSGYNNPIELHIVDNTVENVGFVPNQEGESVIAEEAPNGFAAINLDISGDGYAEISGNTLGNNFEYGLYARSGEIDLTGATNTIQNTAIGMGFYPASKDAPDGDSQEYFDFLASQLKLTNDTIGTTAFVDQSEFFVDLGYGAFFAPGTPTILNGNDATYTLGGATIAPSVYGGVTQAEYDVLEARFNHFVDFQNRGLFFFNILPEIQTFDQEDAFRTFNFPTEFGQGGSLIVTGLPRIAGVAAPVAGGFNPNAIEPAAGDGETTGGDVVAGIEPAAGGGATNSACWADATQTLGQGTPISFDFGGGSSALLQDAAKCGSGTNDQNL